MRVREIRRRKAPAPQGWALLLETYVAGVHYHAFGDGRMPMDEGMVLTLIREPGNQYDPSAIAVSTPSGLKLGYVPRRKNRLLARLMDAGWATRARLERLETPNQDVGRLDQRGGRAALDISIFIPRL